MYTSVDVLAFDLVLCTHDNCLVVLLTQDHVFYLFKIHQLQGFIDKRVPLTLQTFLLSSVADVYVLYA